MEHIWGINGFSQHYFSIGITEDASHPIANEGIKLIRTGDHCTGLTQEAWQIMRDCGVKVTVDPRSDAQYGLEEGVFAYQHAIDHGILPGIGTDLETAYGGDMVVPVAGGKPATVEKNKSESHLSC